MTTNGNIEVFAAAQEENVMGRSRKNTTLKPSGGQGGTTATSISQLRHCSEPTLRAISMAKPKPALKKAAAKKKATVKKSAAKKTAAKKKA